VHLVGFIIKKFVTMHGHVKGKLNTSSGLSFICIPCKQSTANVRLIKKLIVSPGTCTLWRALVADLATESGSFCIEVAIG
jgi:hypothetical protein